MSTYTRSATVAVALVLARAVWNTQSAPFLASLLSVAAVAVVHLEVALQLTARDADLVVCLVALVTGFRALAWAPLVGALLVAVRTAAGSWTQLYISNSTRSS